MKKQIIYLSLAANMALLVYCAYSFIPRLLTTVGNKTSELFTSNNQKNRPWVTVWVHGTRLVHYPVFRNFFDVPQGITNARELSPDLHHQQIAAALCTEDPAHFTLEHCYTFGWSGTLSFETRQEAALNLAESLTTLVAEYRKKGLQPQLRVITHSHGGNIALNMGHTEQTFAIDQLILLACPVQEKTKHYIHSPLFKQVMVLYSPWDIIQIIDPQGLYQNTDKDTPTFSERTFPAGPHIHQVELWSNNRGPMHIEFLLCDSLTGVVRLLPRIIAATREHFTAHYAADELKPVKKLTVHDDKSLEWVY